MKFGSVRYVETIKKKENIVSSFVLEGQETFQIKYNTSRCPAPYYAWRKNGKGNYPEKKFHFRCESFVLVSRASFMNLG
jgi:hypothetical protein